MGKPSKAQSLGVSERSSETILAEIGSAKAASTAAVAEFDATVVAYDDEPSIEAHERRTRAEVARDQARKRVEKLEAELAGIVVREAEAARQKIYDEVVRERNAVEALLREKYPELAGEIAKILARLGSLESRIEQVNKDLPAGAAPLEEAEFPIRRSPGRAEAFEPLRRSVNLPNLTGGQLNIWPADAIR